MGAIAHADVPAAVPSRSVRHLLTLMIVASLPFTYGLTVRVVFPIKIYEVLLCLCVALVAAEGRAVTAPGLRPFVEPVAAFLITCAVVVSFRLVLPLDSFSTEGFEARIGPAGDAIVKLAYWVLALVAFVLVATAAYEDPERVGRWWCIGAIVGAVYGWMLSLSSVFGFPAPLLPGMEQPQIINVGGRELFRGGPFQEGNYFAMYLLTSLAVALWMRWRWTAVLMATTVFITFSTANVVALALFGCIYSLGVGRQSRDPLGRWYAIGAFALVGAAVLAVLFATGYIAEFFIAKLALEEFGSKLDRVDLAVAGLRMWAEHPFVGVGLSHYGYNYRPYQITDFFDRVRPVKPIANSPWIELLAETGVLGTGLVATFAWRVWRRTRATPALAFRCGLAAIALGLFTFPSITVLFIWAFCGLVVGIWVRDTAVVPAPARGAT